MKSCLDSCIGSFHESLGRGAVWAASLAVAASMSGCAIDSAIEGVTDTGPCHSVMAGYYCVKPNDSLQSVAFAFGRSAREVAQWNSIAETAPLRAGQVLRLGPPDWRSWHDGAASMQASAPAAGAGGAASQASASSRFVWPVSGVIVREFGVDGARGIEISGRAGTPVRAAAPGRVVYAGDGIKAYGLMVIVKHDEGYVTAYGNNRRLLVAEGDTVKQGASIAEMGARADGHAVLQFEMREAGKPVDPLAHLPAGSGPLASP
ncbi:peptidoglycan DD-metalloendopeptidase family protein [Paraburkholderia sp. J94]|uniref:peptidoglycan DD-metalloendopeptidase family protein n=1 Tax=Paraburkholderia sp. J94 TaxID=2805441 RepID=UPI002AB05444|nr:peptidoglycan DD-metalloendopeptidase family protein [Paraburkholderia sp. J94]